MKKKYKWKNAFRIRVICSHVNVYQTFQGHMLSVMCLLDIACEVVRLLYEPLQQFNSRSHLPFTAKKPSPRSHDRQEMVQELKLKAT